MFDETEKLREMLRAEGIEYQTSAKEHIRSIRVCARNGCKLLIMQSDLGGLLETIKILEHTLVAVKRNQTAERSLAWIKGELGSAN